jgi:hypothetical protein
MPFTAAGVATQVGAQSGVMSDIPDGEKWVGSPAAPGSETKRIWLIGIVFLSCSSASRNSSAR